MLVSSIPPRARWALGIVSLVAAGCVTFAAREPKGTVVDTASPSPLEAAAPIACGKPAGARTATAPQGHPGARAGAQKGLAFVAREATAWQEKNNCYGCHVQAVTLEALSIGRHNDYAVSQADLAVVLKGLTDIGGGSRGPNGLSLRGSTTYIETAKEFGGAAFARYDAFAGPEVRADLMKVASEISEYQDPDGSVRTTHQSMPVTVGPMQSTTQSLQTWRQAYERSADERWLAPMRKAEAYLQMRAKKLADDREARIVDLNYAAIGLVSAGAQGSEGALRTIAGRLRKAARADGGWGFSANDESNAFATGQTLYALRLLGSSDDDAVVSKGTAWLLSHQGEDGGWSHQGRDKAEAMWAVLGLVSVDVVSIAASGIEDGQHLHGRQTVRARAADNTGQGVERVELTIDDVPVARACGGNLEFSFDADRLSAGSHLVDVTAFNARGQKSLRRLEVYSGAHYLTQLGTRFTDGGTMVSLRDVAPRDVHGEVVLRIFSTRDEAGRAVRNAEVHRAAQPSTEGAMSFFWGSAPRGKYLAEVSFVDESKKTVQTVEAPFVHDTLEAQLAKAGEVEGNLSVNGDAPAANTQVDLVDDQGRVIQSTTTTGNGNYRFRNVDRGSYKVRVQKRGFKAAEAEVQAAPAAARPAPKMDLKLQ